MAPGEHSVLRVYAPPPVAENYQPDKGDGRYITISGQRSCQRLDATETLVRRTASMHMDESEFLRVDGGYILAPHPILSGSLHQRTVLADDGVPLAVYESGEMHGTGLLLALPLGVPVTALASVVSRLSRSFRVITWESRGYPSLNDDFCSSDISFNAHVRDLLLVARTVCVPDLHLVGFCGGGAIALKAALLAPARFQSVASIAGYLNLFEVGQTTFTTIASMVFGRIARDRSLAASFARMASRRSTKDYDGIPQKTAFLDCINRVYTSPDLTYRYARILSESYSEAVDSWLRDVESRVFLISILDDEVVPAVWASYAHKQIRGSTLQEYPNGGHWAWCKSDSIPDYLEMQLLALRSSTPADKSDCLV